MSDGMLAYWTRAMGQGNHSIREVFERETHRLAQCDDDDTPKGQGYQPRANGDDRPIDAVSRSRPARKIGSRRFRMARGITVDSGAADNVMPRRMIRGKFNKNKVRPSEASIAGVHYVACNNGRIKNEGEVDFQFETTDGTPMSWCFQVAEVNKALAAVSALVDSNHRVVFDKDMATGADISCITDKATGVGTKMRRERNVWVVDAYVEDSDLSLDFARPE